MAVLSSETANSCSHVDILKPTQLSPQWKPCCSPASWRKWWLYKPNGSEVIKQNIFHSLPLTHWQAFSPLPQACCYSSLAFPKAPYTLKKRKHYSPPRENPDGVELTFSCLSRLQSISFDVSASIFITNLSSCKDFHVLSVLLFLFILMTDLICCSVREVLFIFRVRNLNPIILRV